MLAKKGCPTKLTDELTMVICDFIERGVFGHIAAQAAGVSFRTYFDWMRRGDQGDGEEPFASFASQVNTAKAQARAVREMKVAETDPMFWLRCGPGRERPSDPDNHGWTVSSQQNVEVKREIDIVSLRNLVLEAQARQRALDEGKGKPPVLADWTQPDKGDDTGDE
jgi:hypothetical protein